MGEGIDGFSVGTRNVFLEIGRMVYARHGSATSAKGHIGLSNAAGTPRIIKFNTHGGTTGAGNANAISDCNNLRQLLVKFAVSAKLPGEKLREIYKELDLMTADNSQPKSLLERSAVAKVVEIIGGKEVWKDVEASYSKSKYKSTGDVTYDAVAQGQGPTNNAKELEQLKDLDVHYFGMSVGVVMAEIGLHQTLNELGMGEDGERGRAIDDLVNRTLKDESAVSLLLLNARSLRTATEGEFDGAVKKSLLRIVVANVPKQDRAAFLAESGKFAEKFGLTKDELSRLALDADLLDLCGAKAGSFGVDNPADMKAAVLQQLLKQDLRGTKGDVASVSETITFGSVRMKAKLPKYALAALKDVLGVGQPKNGDFVSFDAGTCLAKVLAKATKDQDVMSDKSRRKKFLALAERLGSTPEEVGANYVNEFKRKDVYPDFAAFLDNPPPKLDEKQRQAIANVYANDLKTSYSKLIADHEEKENQSGFEEQFVRKMASDLAVQTFTLNGKEVPKSSLAVPKSIKIGKHGSAAANFNNDNIDVTTVSGHFSLSSDALQLLAGIEKMIPDYKTRFLLTRAMGMNSPIAGLVGNPESFPLFGYTAEQYVSLVSNSENNNKCFVSTMLDSSSLRYDLSVVKGDDGDYAVLKSYVNASPPLDTICGANVAQMSGGKSVALTQNWMEVTVKVKIGQDLPGDTPPEFTTEVRQLGDTNPFKKQDALKNILAFVKEADAHGNSGSYYMKLSDDGTGLVNAGKRNIFRGKKAKAENDRVHARLKSYITTYYGGEDKIPDNVRDMMTDFTGGHPLSASRISKIWKAMNAQRPQENQEA